jgi:hypothetical protein
MKNQILSYKITMKADKQIKKKLKNKKKLTIITAESNNN